MARVKPTAQKNKASKEAKRRQVPNGRFSLSANGTNYSLVDAARMDIEVVRLVVYHAIVLAAAGALPAAGTDGKSLEQFVDVRSLT